jgi:hypothetical protein
MGKETDLIGLGAIALLGIIAYRKVESIFENPSKAVSSVVPNITLSNVIPDAGAMVTTAIAENSKTMGNVFASILASSHNVVDPTLGLMKQEISDLSSSIKGMTSGIPNNLSIVINSGEKISDALKSGVTSSLPAAISSAVSPVVDTSAVSKAVENPTPANIAAAAVSSAAAPITAPAKIISGGIGGATTDLVKSAVNTVISPVLAPIKPTVSLYDDTKDNVVVTKVNDLYEMITTWKNGSSVSEMKYIGDVTKNTSPAVTVPQVNNNAALFASSQGNAVENLGNMLTPGSSGSSSSVDKKLSIISNNKLLPAEVAVHAYDVGNNAVNLGNLLTPGSSSNVKPSSTPKSSSTSSSSSKTISLSDAAKGSSRFKYK